MLPSLAYLDASIDAYTQEDGKRLLEPRWKLIPPTGPKREPEDVLEVEYGTSDAEVARKVKKRLHTLVRKGNVVVSIDRPGRCCPLFNGRESTQRTGGVLTDDW